MKKRIKKYIIIAAAILVIIVTFYLIKANNSEENSLFLKALEVEGESSLELINTALAEEKIDKDTAALYKMYSVFDEDQLPAEYKSEAMIINANEAFIEVREVLEELKPETKEALAPFLKRPNDPNSYFNLNYEKITEASADKTAGLIPTAYARLNVDANLYCSTCFLPTGNGRVKIWYPDVSVYGKEPSTQDTVLIDQTTLFSMAQRLQTTLDTDRVFERFADLLQREPNSDGTLGGDDSFDIYVSPISRRVAAVAIADTLPLPSSAYIIVNAAWLGFDNYYKSNLAHEMFHAFQYSYKWKVSTGRWWAEATAVWSEDFTYKGFNSEQRRLKYFLPYPEKSVFENSPATFKYGAYILPYFIAQNFQADMIRNIWEDCTPAGCTDAVDSNLPDGFQKQWKEFTLWNYNILPVRNYTDSGGFPTMSSSANAHDEFLAGDEKIKLPELKPLSAKIIRLNNMVDTNTFKQLIFKNFEEFTGLSDKAGLKAVIYLEDGTKKVEDWGEIEERTFCLKCDKDNDECVEEKLKYIALIPSNGDKSGNIISSEIETEGKPEACTGSWVGTLTAKETMTITAPFVGTIVKTWNVTIKEELEMVHVGKDGAINPKAALNDTTIDLEFHVMKQDIKYDFKQTSIAQPITGSGETKREHPHPESRGSLINNDTELDTIVRFKKKKKYDGVQSVLGQGEWIFNDWEQMYGDCNFVAMSDGTTGCPEYFSCGDSDGSFIGGNEIIIEPTDNESRIKGSETYNFSFMGATTKTELTWDYRKK